jgi:shikimate kinase
MHHLKKNGIIIFLDASLDTLRARIHNYETRGLAKRPEQSFDDLFQERFELYTRYADIIIDSNDRTQDQVCDDIYLKLQPLLKS